MTLAAASLGEVGDFLTGIASLGLVIGGLFAARQAYGQYQVQTEQTRIQTEEATEQRSENRGRWLMELSARFSDTPSFVTIREQLHRGEESALVAALRKRQAVERRESEPGALSEDDAKLLVALDSYLDFLGLVFHMVDHDYLDEDAASDLFDWYVIDQLEIEPVKDEIERGFGMVRELQHRFAAIRQRERAARAPARSTPAP